MTFLIKAYKSDIYICHIEFFGLRSSNHIKRWTKKKKWTAIGRRGQNERKKETFKLNYLIAAKSKSGNRTSGVNSFNYRTTLTRRELITRPPRVQRVIKSACLHVYLVTCFAHICNTSTYLANRIQHSSHGVTQKHFLSINRTWFNKRFQFGCCIYDVTTKILQWKTHQAKRRFKHGKWNEIFIPRDLW